MIFMTTYIIVGHFVIH